MPKKDTLRMKLDKRAREWNRAKPTPSKVRSERLKKKLMRGAKAESPVGNDCRHCEREPCGKTLDECRKAFKIEHCKKCGLLIRYRYISDQPWSLCPVCSGDV